MMNASKGAKGLVFFSHASEDKNYVDEVLQASQRSHIFYDTLSMNPGKTSVEEMERGVLNAQVFVLFVSPRIELKDWVQYEASLAKVEKIKRKSLKIIVVPIQGATYRDAPVWMQSYFSTNEHYTPRDIARTIQSSFEQALREVGDLPQPLCEGRNEFENLVIREMRTRPGSTGVPISVLHLYGLPAMGRLTFARHIQSKIFPGMRQEHPFFHLARQADAKDLFLTLRSEIEGEMGPERLADLIDAWPVDDPSAMASLLVANFAHFAQLNQPVVIKCARGIRDVATGAKPKPWVDELFNQLLKRADIKLIWISEIALPTQTISRYKNVLQFEVGELSSDSIFVILSELLGLRDTPPLSLLEIAQKIGGHAGTAGYVAEVVRLGQRGLDAMIADPSFVVAYQQQFVEELLERKNLSDTKFGILQILAILPSLDFVAISDVLVDASKEEVIGALDELTEVGLVSFSLNTQYKMPEIARSVFLLKHPALNRDLVARVSEVLVRRLNSSKLTIETANALIFAGVLLEQKIPDALRHIVTPAVLHDLVYEQFQLGMRFEKDYKKHFECAAKLAEIADFVPMPNDSFETVMVYAAEGMIRIGQDPIRFIERLEKRGMAAAEYLRGSDLFHRQRKRGEAVRHLRTALDKGAFTNRSAAMLSKAYYSMGETSKALAVFEEIGEDQVRKNSGMLVQMIRCLRVAGRRQDAERLEADLARLSGEHADFELYRAAAEFRNRNLSKALDWTEKAKAKSRVDRVNLALLETSIQVEGGDFSSLDETANLAVGVGRTDDALSLRARADLRRRGGWRDAEAGLRKISKMNFFDKALLLRAIEQKLEDPAVMADPIAMAAAKRERDALTLDARNTTADFDR